MAGSRKLFVALAGLVISMILSMQAGITAQAGSNRNYLDTLNGGVAAIIDPSTVNSADMTATKARISLEEEKPESKRVMANVESALYLRSEASENAEKIGKLYKDCGGTLLERKDGWTKLQSGNAIGWAKDEYLLFGEEAEALANSVGKLVVHMDEALRVRKEADRTAEVLGVLPKGEITEVILNEEAEADEWVCIAFGGISGYVMKEYVTFDFLIDAGETMEEIKIREKAEMEAKRHVKYGEYTTDADTTMLLAALIHCEARGESYEGQVAVGAVVLNRVRSAAYPNTIHGVIYASGQFTPAMTGNLNKVYESGKIQESCIKAAKEALSGVSNVGDLTHFRTLNGREGLIIGNHVFY